jgi:uncharacterized membrane-anchored protein
MRSIMTMATSGIALVCISTTVSLAQEPQAPLRNAEVFKREMQQMKWYVNTTITLPASNARLVVPNNYGAILGHDAQRLDEIVNGRSAENASTSEAAVLSGDMKAQTDFTFVKSGYISDDDWNTLDANALLRSVSEQTEDQNKERRIERLPELHVVKWLQQPSYDHITHTAFWAIEATDSNGGDVANATAIKLGRDGFERLTTISDMRDYVAIGGPLDLMLRSFSFSAGDGYEEHRSTDKVAGFGIAALVGALVGAKAVKVAAAGGLALFFKPILALFLALLSKAWVLLLAPFVFLKSIISRGRRKNVVVSVPAQEDHDSAPPS